MSFFYDTFYTGESVRDLSEEEINIAEDFRSSLDRKEKVQSSKVRQRLNYRLASAICKVVTIAISLT